MGSINYLALPCPLSKQCVVDKSQQHQEIPNSKNILGTLRIKPGAAGQEARMLSTVLCGPPLLENHDALRMSEVQQTLFHGM